MCNESYLKPTKTSSNFFLPVQKRGGGGRYRQEEESLKGGGPGEARGALAPFWSPSAAPFLVVDPHGIFPFRNS